MQVVFVGGIKTALISRAELAAKMILDCKAARTGGLTQPKVIMASNGSVVARYHADPSFRSNVDKADLIDADGMPLVLATRLLCREPLVERIATTDFIHDASELAANNGTRFFFLGGKPGIADIAAEKLSEAHPGLRIVGTRHGYFTEADEDEICAEILAAGTDVLWIGMGSPRQEALAIRLRAKLPGVAWIRTCGGLFDHMSESVPRAANWMQSIGLEWLHRLMLKPRRLAWRYISTNPVACFHLLTKTFDWLDPADGTVVDVMTQRNLLRLSR